MNVYLDKILYKEESANIKTLDLDGKTLLYRKDYGDYPDDMSDYTTFYEFAGVVSEKVWSWRKLRNVDNGNQIKNYRRIFKIDFWIENPKYTKGTVKKIIRHEIELLGRKQEIKNGEIV